MSGLVIHKATAHCVHCGFEIGGSKLIEAKEDRFVSIYRVACGKPHDWHGLSPIRFTLMRYLKRKIAVTEPFALTEIARREWTTRSMTYEATDSLGHTIIALSEILEEDDKKASDLYSAIVYDTAHHGHFPLVCTFKREIK
jgi:hypothetical protein